MDWRSALDRYLTTPPEDPYDLWADDVIGNKFSDEFYEANEDWIFSPQCETWMERLYRKERTPEEAAAIIERAHKILIKSKK